MMHASLLFMETVVLEELFEVPPSIRNGYRTYIAYVCTYTQMYTWDIKRIWEGYVHIM